MFVLSKIFQAVKSSGFSRLTHCAGAFSHYQKFSIIIKYAPRWIYAQSTLYYAGTTYLLKKSDLTWEGGEVIMKIALIKMMTLSFQCNDDY